MARRDRIIDEVIDKFPNVGNRTLARLLVEQYPELYTVETARAAIRYRFGATGDAARKHATKVELKPHCTLDLPPGIKQVRSPMLFPKPGDWMMLSDIHIPFHHEESIESAVKYAVDHKVRNLYLNGDCVDFPKFSDFVQDPRTASPSGELDLLRRFLKRLKKYFKGELVYKIGNHEIRYERYLYGRASAVVGIEAFELHKVLGLDELGYKCVYSKQHAVIGDYNIFHGHELPSGMGAPANPARTLFNRIHSNGMMGHCHYRTDWTAIDAMSKKLYTTHSIGCLCQLIKDYSPVNSWNHGAGHIKVGDKKKTIFKNLLIDRGQVVSDF